MSFVLNVEELAGNALIDLIENKKQDEVSLTHLIMYRKSIMRACHKENREIFIEEYKYNHTNSFIYSDIIEITEKDKDVYFSIGKGKSSKDLRIFFRSYLPVEIIHVLYKKEVSSSLY